MSEQQQGPPNPITKAAESSNLPRQARARIGQTTDPVPEGKTVDASPELHFPLEPAAHDVERASLANKSPSELGLPERDTNMKEIEKMHGGSAGQVRRAQYQRDQQAGMDWSGTSTATNKAMDSRHRTNDYRASSHGYNKHTDTTTRGR